MSFCTWTEVREGLLSSSTVPRNPVDNWENVRDLWVADVERLVSDTESWAHHQGWGTLRELKAITEDRIGTYTVPRLLIHDLFGRLLVDPYARFVAGGDGLVDLCVIPSWDSEMIIKEGEGWFLLQDDAEGPRQPWTESIFVEAVHRLARSQ
jgi:hypothetical protein